jgi:hypothetical protein
VFIPYNKPRLTVEEVESVIYQAQDRRKAKMGKGFDLLVCDYPAKLGTESNRKGNLSVRDKDDYVYDVFTQIALDLGVHCLDAIQTNRDGSKINKGYRGAEKRLLTMEDVKESWGPMTTATNVISLNRSPEDEANNRLIAHLCKSRSAEVGWSIICNTNYAAATTHSDDLGCAWYRGTSPMSETIDVLLQQYKGNQIPAQALGI